MEQGKMYLSDGDQKLFRVVSADTLNTYLESGNDYKIREFLYPVLNDVEREHGVDDRFNIDKNGTLTSAPSNPDRNRIRDIDIFDIF